MFTTKQQTGQQSEQATCDFLKTKGMSLLEKNYFCSQGEIDLIMNDNNTIVFVEVRFRQNTQFGSGAETVDRRKQNKLLHTTCKRTPKLQKIPVDFMLSRLLQIKVDSNWTGYLMPFRLVRTKSKKNNLIFP